MDISHGNTEPCWWPLLNDIYPLRLYRGVAKVSYVHNKQYRIFSCGFSKKTWSLVEKYYRTNFNAFYPWSNCRESCKPVLLQIMAWCQNDTEPILKTMITQFTVTVHDDVIKWKHFPRNWPFCAGNSPVPGEFHAQRPVTQSFDVFFDLRLNIRLSKQSSGRWFETLSPPLFRHCNGYARRSTFASTELLYTYNRIWTCGLTTTVNWFGAHHSMIFLTINACGIFQGTQLSSHTDI